MAPGRTGTPAAVLKAVPPAAIASICSETERMSTMQASYSNNDGALAIEWLSTSALGTGTPRVTIRTPTRSFPGPAGTGHL